MIKKIEREVIWSGRQNGGTWYHPRAGKMSDGSVLMTCQRVTDSDTFGPVYWSKTTDNGMHWSELKPVAAFARKDIGGGYEEGVCDAVPEYHALTGKILLMGHNVFYKDGGHVLTLPEGRQHHSVYCVGDGNGDWSARYDLKWDDPRAAGFYSCGCAQRFTLENGDVVVPLYFSRESHTGWSVSTARYSFDGELLTLEEMGRELRLDVNDGIEEPALTRFGLQYYLTMRASDGHGYLSTSTDALNWSDIAPWTFDDGEVLAMSPTQQRWLTHSDGLFLVYTRKTAENYNVFRWRAPLYMAQVDTEKQCLLRHTEQVIFPMDGDGTAPGQLVARMGNFHTTNVSSHESWVTVGECRPNHGWCGDTLLARIYWETPNTLIF